MKKYLLSFVVFGAVVVIAIILSYSPKSSSKKSVAQSYDSTNSSVETPIAASNIKTSGFDALPRSAAISAIDAANPSYTVPMALMEMRFAGMIERGAFSKALSPEVIAQLAHHLAALRLSQSVFEASIAKVSRAGKEVIISIPAYQQEGDDLRRQVLDELLSAATDASFRQGIRTQFAYFGQSAQRITISADATPSATELYTIVHRYDNLDGTGPGTDIAKLDAERLGAYTPFVAWVPKR